MLILNEDMELKQENIIVEDTIDRSQVLSEAGIYMIECLRNGKIYIGRSVNMLNRVRNHGRALSNGSHINKHLQNTYNKYGSGSLVARTVEVLPEGDWLLHQERESYWVNYYDTFNDGFNIAPIVIGDRPPVFIDRVSGENHHSTKLSESDVIRICELLNEGVMRMKDIAEMFNATYATISGIRYGRSWTHITSKHLSNKGKLNRLTHLSESDIIRICELLNEGVMRVKDIAEMFNVTPVTISAIKNGKTWTHITRKHLNNKGKLNQVTHLSESDVIRICELLNEGMMRINDIAEMFKVSINSIYTIKCGGSWTHITRKHLNNKGKLNRVARLSESDVIRICELLNEGVMRMKDIAKMFNVTPETISNIKRGKTKTHITDKHLNISPDYSRSNPNAKLSESDVIRICELLNEDVITIKEIASMYNVTPETIYEIRKGKAWTHITDQYLKSPV